MIPPASRYPDEFDGQDNMFVVHDSLQLRLLEDYLPGAATVLVDGDASRFPASGVITLTDQLSELSSRALSLYYSSRDAAGFYGVEAVPGAEDVPKPKHDTWVTMNVRAENHNRLVACLSAAQAFAGRRGVVDLRPLGETLEGRINYLRRLALRPRAWFAANRRIGIVPFTVTFTDLSFRGPTYWQWDFGDGTTIDSEDEDMTGISMDPVTKAVTKTFYDAGSFDITLTVSNENGEDTIVIPEYITARIAAPDEAMIEFSPDNTTQAMVGEVLYTRTAAVVNAVLSDTGEQTGDPIVSYEWDWGDDLGHGNAPLAKAQYAIGGVYDVLVTTSTLLKAYRTTLFAGKVNVVERDNIWLLVFSDAGATVTKDVKGYEFGLLSETFKTASRSSQSVTRNASMVNSAPDASRKVAEYRRNCGFATPSDAASGDKASALVFWTEGEHAGSVGIRFRSYQGFLDSWTVPAGLDLLDRGWNWVSLVGSSKLYLLFGTTGLPASNPPGTSPTNQTRQDIDLHTLVVTNTVMDSSFYRNGAEELEQNTGLGTGGDFSVYRSCFKGSNGFIARNAGVGTFFRIASFYRTEGTLGDEFLFVRKLPDIPGTTKLEGQLVPMSDGVYFFDNSGEIVAYGTADGTWRLAGPGANSSPFRALQDQSAADFDNLANSLVANSDSDANAYLSYDYSPSVFLKFNSLDRTFRRLVARPAGEQFMMGRY